MTDNQYLLAHTVCFGHSLKSTLFIHNYSGFLFQLFLMRGSTFPTITLAIVLDAVLGHHDGNLQFLCSIFRMSDAYHCCRP